MDCIESSKYAEMEMKMKMAYMVKWKTEIKSFPFADYKLSF